MKTLKLTFLLLCLTVKVSLAVNSSPIENSKKEIVQKRETKNPSSIKQKVSLFLLKKWTKQNAKKRKRQNQEN